MKRQNKRLCLRIGRAERARANVSIGMRGSTSFLRPKTADVGSEGGVWRCLRSCSLLRTKHRRGQAMICSNSHNPRHVSKNESSSWNNTRWRSRPYFRGDQQRNLTSMKHPISSAWVDMAERFGRTVITTCTCCTERVNTFAGA